MPTKRLLVLELAFVLACKPPTPAEQMDSILSSQRLSAWTLGRPIRGPLSTRAIYSPYQVPWEELGLSDPRHPRLRVAKRDPRHAK